MATSPRHQSPTSSATKHPSSTKRSRGAAHRRKRIALALGVSAACTVGAAATGLGGLVTEQIGAATGDVGACDSDGIDLDYRTVYDASRKEYMVDRVYMADLDLDCFGLSYKFSIVEVGSGGQRQYIERDNFYFGFYDRDPSAGVDLAGQITYSAYFPAADLNGAAITIGGRDIDL